MCDTCDDLDEVTCPACDYSQEVETCLLGTLGNLNHYRCRYCGIDFNSPVVKTHQEITEEDHRDNVL